MRFNLPNRMLTKVDRASMAASLEVRVPFLDNEMIDFSAQLPLHLKIRGLRTKHIVRNALKKRVPFNHHQRSKHGFDVPYKQWLRNDLVNMARNYLDPQTIDKQGILNSAIVNQIVTDHQTGAANYTRQIYGLIIFQIWFNTFIEREKGFGK